ncbi:hypothetical protein AHAS_Ahas11G0176200 [Arachis hypogaea]
MEIWCRSSNSKVYTAIRASRYFGGLPLFREWWPFWSSKDGSEGLGLWVLVDYTFQICISLL